MSRKISAAQAVTSCGQRGGATSASPAHYGRGLRAPGSGAAPEAARAAPRKRRALTRKRRGAGRAAMAAEEPQQPQPEPLGGSDADGTDGLPSPIPGARIPLSPVLPRAAVSLLPGALPSPPVYRTQRPNPPRSLLLSPLFPTSPHPLGVLPRTPPVPPRCPPVRSGAPR